MRNRLFFGLFVVFNFVLVGIFINQQTKLSRLYYQKQAYMKKLKEIHKTKIAFIEKFELAQNHEKIKEYALHELNMVPLSLKKVKRVAASNAEQGHEQCV